MQALSASLERPVCRECGREDGPEGGGRYGFADHEGIFFCGRCWKAWDDEEKAKIMRPAYEQARSDRDSIGADAAGAKCSQDGEELPNFFASGDHKEGCADDDEVVAWSPDFRAPLRPGELALPASERPTCAECGREEGEEGGGRYRRDDTGYRFFCGRCWQAWNPEAQRSMMMGFAPLCSADPVVEAYCPPPDCPAFDDADPWQDEADDDPYWREESGDDARDDDFGVDLGGCEIDRGEPETSENAGAPSPSCQVAAREAPALPSRATGYSAYAAIASNRAHPEEWVQYD